MRRAGNNVVAYDTFIGLNDCINRNIQSHEVRCNSNPYSHNIRKS